MTHARRATHATCAICGKSLPVRNLVSGELVRAEVTDEILKDHPEWSAESYICRPDLAEYRGRWVNDLLESERGEISALEAEVVESLRRHELLASDVEEEFDEQRTLGDRMADRMADFGGSWTFLILFALFLGAWIVMNTVVLAARPKDPYPFIFLNLLLSCLAAIQAPIIMMSQNRQEAKDRLRSQHDYQVNLKAELEIRHLHDKVDHLLSHQWDRLVQIQELQLELLSDLSEGR